MEEKIVLDWIRKLKLAAKSIAQVTVFSKPLNNIKSFKVEL